jgi:hypothetical protein
MADSVQAGGSVPGARSFGLARSLGRSVIAPSSTSASVAAFPLAASPQWNPVDGAWTMRVRGATGAPVGTPPRALQDTGPCGCVAAAAAPAGDAWNTRRHDGVGER